MGPSDCIYCGDPAGSAEHTILAALGGLRADRGILCEPCNNTFGHTIDEALIEDMRAINAMIGVMNGRTKDPVTIRINDEVLGRSYVLSGRHLQNPEAVAVSVTEKDGLKSWRVVGSNQKQLDDFVRKLRDEGKHVRARKVNNVPHLIAEAPTVKWGFGGTDPFRAIARLALNVLAHMRPELARGDWLVPLKKFIKEGGQEDPWVSYVEPGTLPFSQTFDFLHWIAVLLDSESGNVSARVSLLGIYELSVRLGTTTIGESESLLYEMNVLATSPPLDMAKRTIPGLLFPSNCAQQATSEMVDQMPGRMAEVIAKHHSRIWDEDAPDLVAALNAVRELDEACRRDAILKALAAQKQRLLNLMRHVAKRIRERLTAELGEEEGARAGDAFDRLVQADRESWVGISESTYAHLDNLQGLMAEHLQRVLSVRQLEATELRLLLEGGPGASIVGKYMMAHVEGELTHASSEAKPS